VGDVTVGIDDPLRHVGDVAVPALASSATWKSPSIRGRTHFVARAKVAVTSSLSGRDVRQLFGEMAQGAVSIASILFERELILIAVHPPMSKSVPSSIHSICTSPKVEP